MYLISRQRAYKGLVVPGRGRFHACRRCLKLVAVAGRRSA